MRLPIRVFQIPDSSMEPGLVKGGYVLASRIHWKMKEGDLVLIKHPFRNSHMVRRIGKKERDGYFVVGDNQTLFSEDSKEFGKVTDNLVAGKVIFKW